MNFTQFLKTDKMLSESYVTECTDPVVLGLGTFHPCHIGYLQLVAELVTLGEQLNAEPVLVIVEQGSDSFTNVLPSIIRTLAANYPALTVRVEEDLSKPIKSLCQSGRTTVGAVGEAFLVNEAVHHFKSLTRVTMQARVMDFTPYKNATMAAISEGSLIKFRSSILECPSEVAELMYEQLLEDTK